MVIFISALIILPGLFSNCTDSKDPIKIGFVGGLTGPLSDLGIAGRDGVMLAVEQINKQGGINGRTVTLITKDDQQNPDVALKVDKELINEGVAAIIGHMTSSMTITVLPLINQEKTVLLSPTSSAEKLSGKDDFFLRVESSSKLQAQNQAVYAFQNAGLRKMAAVYDISNKAYTEEWVNNNRAEFEKLGGKIIFTTSFDSKEAPSYPKIAKSILDAEPQGVVVVASALTSAMIVQHLRQQKSEIPVFGVSWAYTNEFLQSGGAMVEGTVFNEQFFPGSQNQGFVEFKNKFNERFSKTPNFASTRGYEAATILFKGLKKTKGSVKGLKQAILGIKKFQGLQGNIWMDEFGDTRYDDFFIKVKDGKFILIND